MSVAGDVAEQSMIFESITSNKNKKLTSPGESMEPAPRRCFACGTQTLSPITVLPDCPHVACSLGCYHKVTDRWIEIKNELQCLDRTEDAMMGENWAKDTSPSELEKSAFRATWQGYACVRVRQPSPTSDAVSARASAGPSMLRGSVARALEPESPQPTANPSQAATDADSPEGAEPASAAQV